MSSWPVNALVVGDTEPVAWCSNHGGYVYEREAVLQHGGRGREPKVSCIGCMRRSAETWMLTGCEFCMGAGKRVLAALDEYQQTGKVTHLDEVPTDQLPPHRVGCPWEGDVLDGQAVTPRE